MFNCNLITGAVVGGLIGSSIGLLVFFIIWFWNPVNVEKRKTKRLKKVKEEMDAYKNSFTKWLRDNWDEDNMLPPALDADDAFVFLKYYLLGPDWYVNYPGSSEQIITEMTYDILKKYSKKFRKECEKNDFR